MAELTQLGALFQSELVDDVREIKELASSTSWAVEDVRAHHRAPSGDSRDVIDTHTGGPPKHHIQHDFGAAWRPPTQGDPSHVFSHHSNLNTINGTCVKDATPL